MRPTAPWLGLCAALLSAPAYAQGANFVNVAGTVETVSRDTVAVKTDGGAVETVKLSPKLVVVRNMPATPADIHAGDFVASAAVRGPDGKLHSTELRIFPEAMRGVGEGQRPMNDARSQTMTNATVTGTAVAGGGRSVKVKFPGGESELVVDPGVPLTRIVPLDRAELKPGAKVRMRAAKNADGLSAGIVTVQ
jgi:hypothetical protein